MGVMAERLKTREWKTRDLNAVMENARMAIMKNRNALIVRACVHVCVCVCVCVFVFYVCPSSAIF